MDRFFITFRSITPAQHAQKLLQSAGIRTTIQRTPRWMEAQGCGYRLSLPPQLLENALELLKSHRIPYQKIYQQTPDGTTREVTP
jgi:hypothetical protein